MRTPYKEKKLLTSLAPGALALLFFLNLCNAADIEPVKHSASTLLDDTNIKIASENNGMPLSGSVFTFVVMADTQAFRLDGSENIDPNSERKNGDAWRRINHGLMTALNKYSGIEFGLINGDITEYGREDSWREVIKIYNNLKFPYYIGLGNHDYSNNLHDCRTVSYPLDSNACAIYSIRQMEAGLSSYSLKLDNFSKDWNQQPNNVSFQGSLSYSWDYKGVHFVQLQNYPNYTASVESSGGFHYNIHNSLTWLREDLRLARLRGINDIILNFHQDDDEFPNSVNTDEKQLFRAILETFRPLAIFVGHRHRFGKETYYNHPLFGNATVYRTGSAFKGQAHIVTYAAGELDIKEIDSTDGTVNTLREHEQTEINPKPICLTQSTNSGTGSIYVTTFFPQTHRNLRQVLRSGDNVDANSKGEAYLKAFNPGNTYQEWTFEKAYLGWPEFNSWYIIKQKATGRVLDSNAKGEVYTNPPGAGNPYQQWRPVMTNHGELLLQNRATNRFLDGNSGKLYTNFVYDALNPYKVWQVSNSLSRTPDVPPRYFRARTDSSFQYSFPQGQTSDANWEYLGEYSISTESPCIAW